LPRMTALENVELPLIYAGKRHLKEKARVALAEVGLSERFSHRPNQLSGGQQQRVTIARSLVNEPLIILADEPTGNLDTKSQQEIMSILTQLNEKGKTVVIVTHEKEIAAYAKRIIQMRDGRIISDESNEKEKAHSPQQAPGQAQGALYKSQRSIGKAEFLDYLRQATDAMLAHKMRSLLSILGILIGVAAVIAMLALGQGAKQAIEQQLASLGSNLLIVRPGSSKVHGVALEAGAVTRFTFQDIAAINKLTDEVNSVSPYVTGRGQLVYANKNWNTQVEGASVDYAQMRASVPEVGRFFTEEELRLREKVAVVGTTVVRELFGDADPVGQTLKINLINFKIIGILPAKGATSFHDQDDRIVVPITTAMYRLFGKQYVDSIFVEAKGPNFVEPAQEAISKIIIKQHHLNKSEEDSFSIMNMSDIKETLESTTRTMALLLGAIAAISLLVGGIGIMNIMLVSVTERTREIGLRKAIGASNKDILVQFLIEAILMAFIGGISGILLGTGASALITIFAHWTVKVSFFSMALATTFSVIVGIAFGLWPAQKAARLNPIEALRYE